MTLAKGFLHVDIVNQLNKAVPADDDLAFATVANYRAQNDSFSLLGAHSGAPMRVIKVDGSLAKQAAAAGSYCLVGLFGGNHRTDTGKALRQSDLHQVIPPPPGFRR
jgi:hypothetical protein